MPVIHRIFASILWALVVVSIHAAQDVEGNPVLKLGDTAPIDSPGTYYSDLHPCPAACLDNKPENWTVYSTLERLQHCREGMLFDLAIYNPVNSLVGSVKLRTCTAGTPRDANTTVNALYLAVTSEGQISEKTKRDALELECLAASATKTDFSLVLGQRGAKVRQVDNAVLALKHLQGFMAKDGNCDVPVILGYSNRTVVGMYLGPAFGRDSASSVIERLVKHAQENGLAETTAVQLCGDPRNANHVLGVAISSLGDVAAVQKLLAAWSQADCPSEFDQNSTWEDVPGSESDADLRPAFHSQSKRSAHLAHHHRHGHAHLHPRADCEVATVVAGDNCDALAARCGITTPELIEYSGNPELCLPGRLRPGQRVCCNRGTLPDIRPKPNEDGSCFAYTVQPGDDCSYIARTHGLSNTVLERYNNKTTWGWNGCNDLKHGIAICLSNGDPPLPAPVANAVCGPTKPGTQRPTDGTNIADLNPCPLNVCCNIWGQCGINEDFCLEERGPAGNPGTSPDGKNGCVSSCGTEIHNNNELPVTFGRIGYYETWNFDRKCLWLRAKNADIDGTYSIIHWAFAEVDPDGWTVRIVDEFKQWEDFNEIATARRIISFGGWGYSTEPETYDILRQAMSPPNRKTFAINVAKFVKDEGLDGVDFDWEYPGAMDIPDTPPGLETDGPNYYKFLIVMRGQLEEGKSLSIAAPASYWYLKAFPIAQMAKELDYIVYMTYDLHVNLTETTYALSMRIYGRSFLMSKKGCTGPDCFFKGDRLNSPAAKGKCTNTGGYISNAEIDDILILNHNTESWHDGASNSDILVYDAFTDDEFYNYTTGEGGEEILPPLPPRPVCKYDFASIEALDAQIDLVTDERCMAEYILELLHWNITAALNQYDDLLEDGYDGKFKTYAKAVVSASGKVVEEFVYAHGADYFSCVVTEEIQCCELCEDDHHTNHPEINCRYCEEYDCVPEGPCDNPEVHCDPPEFRYRNMTQPCPPDYSLRGQSPPSDGRYTQSVYWTLEDPEHFWGDLFSETGVGEEDIVWKDVSHFPCNANDKHCADKHWDYNFPVPSEYNIEDVIDPKDVVAEAYDKLTGLKEQLDEIFRRLEDGTFVGDMEDVVDAVSIPVMMTSDAVDNMMSIVEVAEEIEEAKAKGILFAFLSAIFFIVPVVGEVISGVTSLVNVGRIISLLGATGNVVLDIYTILDDEENAPLAIFSLVLTPLALMDIARVNQAANIRRAMPDADVAKLGERLSTRLALVSKLKNRCPA
ncbi:hypothetical protein BJY01DRAFT_261581 [Aspergillus pseudoustus]|uniref:chitinase n=1 Tax=Aspergillus pseudoustus TaxID=1810923 RepID=A0ABR4KDF7_9EURO